MGNGNSSVHNNIFKCLLYALLLSLIIIIMISTSLHLQLFLCFPISGWFESFENWLKWYVLVNSNMQSISIQNTNINFNCDTKLYKEPLTFGRQIFFFLVVSSSNSSSIWLQSIYFGFCDSKNCLWVYLFSYQMSGFRGLQHWLSLIKWLLLTILLNVFFGFLNRLLYSITRNPNLKTS